LSPLDRDFLRQQSSEQASERDFLVGLSVGQGSQTSGVAVLERLLPSRPGASRSYACRYLRRWLPPATAYPALVSDLTDMLSGAPLAGGDLVVEAGPSIKAVLALLRKNRLPARIQPVEVKASAEDDYVEGLWRITKASVIETTRQVLQEDRLVFDERMAPGRESGPGCRTGTVSMRSSGNRSSLSEPGSDKLDVMVVKARYNSGKAFACRWNASWTPCT
jgi:hypothetical protein